MKLTNLQLEAAGYIFEKANGNSHADVIEKIIEESEISSLDVNDLENMIISGIESGKYIDDDSRSNAYCALSKRYNSDLIPFFRRWLKNELPTENDGPLFQLMIALDNLEEPIFNKERSGYAMFETELNHRDAEQYLDNISA